jgi:hypothetical protein
MKKQFSLLILFSFLLNNVTQSIEINSIDLDAINNHKQQIQKQINRQNFLKYTLVTAAVAGVAAYKAYGYFYGPAQNPDVSNLTQQEINYVKSLFSAANMPKDETIFQRLKNFSANALNSALVSAPLMLAAPALNLIFSSINLKSIRRSCNLGLILSSLKLNAINLNPDLEYLKFDGLITIENKAHNDAEQKVKKETVDVKLDFSSENINELLKLQQAAKAIKQYGQLNDQEKKRYIDDIKFLTNNLSNCVTKVLAYLKIQQDALEAKQQDITEIVQLYDSLLKLELQKIEQNNNSRLLVDVFYFSLMLENYLNRISHLVD